MLRTRTLTTAVRASLALWAGIPPAEYVLVVVHASHFVVFLLFGLGLWFARRKAFGRFAAAMLLVMGMGTVGYLVVPTVPPWMAADLHAIPPIGRVADSQRALGHLGLNGRRDLGPRCERC